VAHGEERAAHREERAEHRHQWVAHREKRAAHREEGAARLYVCVPSLSPRGATLHELAAERSAFVAHRS
jgi:hypothetical protein